MDGRWRVGEQDTVLAALERQVQESPARVLLDFSGDEWSYRAVEQASNRLAWTLRELGVKFGDTVTTMLDNNADAVLAWLAINKLGAVSVPLNTALRGEFLRHQLADAASAVLLCESDYVERVVAVEAGVPDLRLILHRADLPDLTHAPGRLAIEPLAEHRGADDRAVDVAVRPDDVACVIYTSGTTGPSKGCVIPHNQVTNVARLKLRGAPAGADDVLFTPLPLYHLNAVSSGVTSTVLVGGRIAIAQRFSVSGFWPEIERSGATIASILGSMGRLLADAPDSEAMVRCYGQVHTVRGNPFTPDVRTIWRERFGARQVGSQDYGLTEAAVVTSLAEGEYVDAPPECSGRRNDDFEVVIVDEEHRKLPPGSAGEIVVRPRRANVMFQGYWRRPEATLNVLGNLWFHTGDIGRFDEAGYFYFVDRKKDYLRRRGENISSHEMEVTFAAHPDVEEVAVHAVPAAVGEDDVKVTAKLYEGATLTERDLCLWAIDRVPYYAVPRYIEFRSELPKNPQGRVLKYQLAQEGVTAATWDHETSDVDIAKR